MKKRSAVIVWMATVSSLLSGCIIQVKTTQFVEQSQPSREVDAIRRVLVQQDQAWNRGDIDTFMSGYWNSPQLSFSSGGRVTKGWQQTKDNYHKRYPNRAAMGHLTFDDLEISILEPGVALVLGRWHLDRDKPIGGAFSLVFRKINRQWLIVHDHTSMDASQ